MNVFIVGGIRTPIGKTNGILKHFLPENLASLTMNKLLTKYKLSAQTIDYVLLGNITGPGGNIARVSVLAAGWPLSQPALSIDGQCGSGLNAIQLAAALIKTGQAELCMAGGTESSSMAPLKQFNSNDPRFEEGKAFFTEAPFSTPEIGDPSIGDAAEQLATNLKISREDMDKWAFDSHQKAIVARDNNILKDIILNLKDGEAILDYDECIRPSLTPKLLSRLPGAFHKDGNITAGNSCLKHDGAAVLLLASESALEKYNLKPQAILHQCTVVGSDPNNFPLSPIPAINKLLAISKLQKQDIDALEINEAFAMKILACCRELDFDLNKVNLLGGALAYGHPYGASGAIITLHLLEALKMINGKYGIASIGAVGGLGTAQLIERIV